MTTIFLIVGAPASGKSTASRALAACFPKSIAIGVDDLRTMVVAGLVHPSAEWSHELTEQLRLARQSATTMALRYHAAGYTVIIDDFWDPQTQMSEYSELFVHSTVRRVLLYPSQQKAHDQNLQRSGPGPLQAYLDEGIKIVYADLRNVVSGLAHQGWHVLDTTTDTVAETVARLYTIAV
jgi:hypothetical protein